MDIVSYVYSWLVLREGKLPSGTGDTRYYGRTLFSAAVALRKDAA
jgi:hypothetical protein